MKKVLFLTLIVGIIVASTGCGPTYRTQQGAVIGAALGAWAGQDIGHDPESTLIGAAVGGVAGAVIGDAVEQYEMNQGGYQYPSNYSSRYPQNTTNRQQTPPPQRYRY